MRRKVNTVTIYDVAREADCSPMTVSRALRDAGGGRPSRNERYRRIREIARRLEYKVNPHARALSRQHTANIGFCINHPAFHYYHPHNYYLLSSLQERLSELGYQLGFYYFRPVGDPLFARFLKHPPTCDAIVFQGRNVSGEELDVIQSSGVRALSLLEDIDGIASITFNEWRGGQLAAESLFQNGHRRVGMLWRGLGAERWNGRIKGFLTRAEELGMEIPSEADIELPFRSDGPMQNRTARDEVARQSFDVLWSRNTGITALYMTSDFISFPVVQRMDELGIRLGVDLSVVSYDNFEALGEGPWGAPRLASVAPPRLQAGITAAEFLAGVLKMGAAPHIKLEPSFADRISLGRISTVHAVEQNLKLEKNIHPMEHHS